MNKVLLVGNLVRKPEIRETKTGIEYTRVTIAVTRLFGDKEADFIPVILWKQQADFISKYAVKGSKVSIEGRFSSSTYTNSNDETVTNYEVTAERVQLLDTKAETERKASLSNDNVASSNKGSEVTQAQDTPADVPWELDL